MNDTELDLPDDPPVHLPAVVCKLNLNLPQFRETVAVDVTELPASSSADVYPLIPSSEEPESLRYLKPIKRTFSFQVRLTPAQLSQQAERVQAAASVQPKLMNDKRIPFNPSNMYRVAPRDFSTSLGERARSTVFPAQPPESVSNLRVHFMPIGVNHLSPESLPRSAASIAGDRPERTKRKAEPIDDSAKRVKKSKSSKK